MKPERTFYVRKSNSIGTKIKKRTWIWSSIFSIFGTRWFGIIYCILTSCITIKCCRYWLRRSWINLSDSFDKDLKYQVAILVRRLATKYMLNPYLLYSGQHLSSDRYPVDIARDMQYRFCCIVVEKPGSSWNCYHTKNGVWIKILPIHCWLCRLPSVILKLWKMETTVGFNYLNRFSPDARLTRMIKQGSFGTWFGFEFYSVSALIKASAGFGVTHKTTIFFTWLIIISAFKDSHRNYNSRRWRSSTHSTRARRTGVLSSVRIWIRSLSDKVVDTDKVP